MCNFKGSLDKHCRPGGQPNCILRNDSYSGLIVCIREIPKRTQTSHALLSALALSDTFFSVANFPQVLPQSAAPTATHAPTALAPHSFMSISRSHSLWSYVGQSVCIDIFSVYWSPESRIGDSPRNRLSHFYVLQKWSGQDLSSISLSITGSPRRSLLHTASEGEGGDHHRHHTSCPACDGLDESPSRWRRWQEVDMNGASLPSDL